jgi:hypothetical protein
VAQALGGQDAKLVYAGDEAHFALYREANTYPHLVDEPLVGNAQRERLDSLLMRANTMMAPHLERVMDSSAAAWRDAPEALRAAGNVGAIITAARQGRVLSLFVAVRDHAWGRYDIGTGAARINPTRMAGDTDLLDLAAVETLRTRGQVFAVERDRMPADVPAAALFRYAVGREESRAAG